MWVTQRHRCERTSRCRPRSWRSTGSINRGRGCTNDEAHLRTAPPRKTAILASPTGCRFSNYSKLTYQVHVAVTEGASRPKKGREGVGAGCIQQKMVSNKVSSMRRAPGRMCHPPVHVHGKGSPGVVQGCGQSASRPRGDRCPIALVPVCVRNRQSVVATQITTCPQHWFRMEGYKPHIQ
jgi:hypothetical protein